MDLFQKKLGDLMGSGFKSWIFLVAMMMLGGFVSAPLFAQEPAGDATGTEQKPENASKGFWSLSDQDRLRDELPTQPTSFEIEKIRAKVDQAFNNFFRMWAEEQYFELYKLGKQQAREYLTPEQFAVRMVQLDWVPVGLVQKPPFEISFRYRTLIYVDAGIKFSHKTKGGLAFEKRQTFLLLWEKGQWRFDLLQMLRSPFYTPNQQG